MSWQRTMAGRGRLAVFVASAAMIAACSGSSDDTAPATSAALDETSNDTHDDVTETSDVELSHTERLEVTPPEIVDPDGEDRCDRLGYPCSWSDVPESDFERSRQLSIELNEIAQGTADAIIGTDAAVKRLQEVDDLAELIVDREGYTGMLFRLEGMPEMYVYTDWAGPEPEDRELDLTALGLELDALVEGGPDATVPQGFRQPIAPEAYHPTGGPIAPKKALVLDPYAKSPTECPEGAPRGARCMVGVDNRIEGSIIHAILDAHDQITSTYVSAGTDNSQADSWDPILGPPLSDFDLVHLTSHGNSGCANLGPGWVQTFSFDDPAPLPDHCFSSSALVPYDSTRYDSLPAEERVAPDGLSLSGDVWVVRDYYWVDKMKSTAIVFMSHCTSADGSFYRSGRYGSYVGWHSYARITTAAEAAITFWTLMATDGVEFDQAIEQLHDRDLTETVVIDRNNGGITGAFLADGGRNQRARDVIKVKIDGADPNGKVLKVNGIPGDGERETFPVAGQQLTFDLEGVRRDTAESVKFELYLDGQKIDMTTELKLKEHGRVIKEGKDWDVWRLTVPEDAFKYRPTGAVDFQPGKQFQLEVRAFEDSDEYTAHGGLILLGAALESTGPLAIFTELEGALEPTGVQVDGNDLRIAFKTYETEVRGHMLIIADAGPASGGFWEIVLDGTYDPATGRMEGEIDASAKGLFRAIIASDDTTGTWQATANLDAQTVTGSLTIRGQSQSYDGTIVRPDTTVADNSSTPPPDEPSDDVTDEPSDNVA